jgi:hypothetical protein
MGVLNSMGVLISLTSAAWTGAGQGNTIGAGAYRQENKK